MRVLLLFLFLVLVSDAKMLLRRQVIMSTFVSISTEQKYERFVEEGFDIIKDIENSLSSYKHTAPVYLLNEKGHAKLDMYSYEALSLSKRYYQKTNGYFDITIGSITKDLYRFGEDERIVGKKQLKDANVCFEGLYFDKKDAYLQKGIKVDLGGMGKGFAVDKSAQLFRKNGVSNAIIAASGDIRCLSTCNIDVQDPFSQDGILVSFETLKSDLGITTSGNYNRYVGSTNNNHLISPKTKEPQKNFISVTLIGDLPSSDLDAYATAVSVMPVKEAYRFLDSLGVSYIILGSDKKLVISKNISKYTKNLIERYTAKQKP